MRDGGSVLMGLIVGFDFFTKVTHKILGSHVADSLCSKNRQTGGSALAIGDHSARREDCPQSYPPKMWVMVCR